MGQTPDPLRRGQSGVGGARVQDVHQKTFYGQDKGPAEEQGIDRPSRQSSDVEPAHVKAHAGVDKKEYERNSAHKHSTQASGMEDKRDQVKFKDGEEEKNEDGFAKPARQAHLEKPDGSFQGQKFNWDILALTLDHVELLNLGDRVDDVFRFPFTTACQKWSACRVVVV